MTDFRTDFNADMIFTVALVGILAIPVLIYLYGVIVDTRRGQTGLLMILLLIGIVAGLLVFETLAIVCAILFASAWIIGTLNKLANREKS